MRSAGSPPPALAQLADEVLARHAALGSDPDSLRQAAREAYEKAIARDADHLAAWAALADSFGPDERASAEAFVTRAQPVRERHRDSPQLARPLARLCALTGQRACTAQYGELWHESARTRADLADADRFLTALKAAMQ